MRTSIKVIAATLSLATMLSNAHAGEQSTYAADRALHRSIAMQGDQALLTIQSSAVDLISQSIRNQMAVSLPLYAVQDDTHQIRPEVVGTEVAQAASGY